MNRLRFILAGLLTPEVFQENREYCLKSTIDEIYQREIERLEIELSNKEDEIKALQGEYFDDLFSILRKILLLEKVSIVDILQIEKENWVIIYRDNSNLKKININIQYFCDRIPSFLICNLLANIDEYKKEVFIT